MTILQSLTDDDICLLSDNYDSCMGEGEGERKLQQLAKSGLNRGRIRWWSKSGQYGFISQKKGKVWIVAEYTTTTTSTASTTSATSATSTTPDDFCVS